jgi:hypothetical protein
VVTPRSDLNELSECAAVNGNGDWKIVNSKHAVKSSNLPNFIPIPALSTTRFGLLDYTHDTSSKDNIEDASNGIHYKYHCGTVYPMKVDIQHLAFRPDKSTFAKDESIHKISTIINGVTNIISNDGSEFSGSDKLHISNGVLCKKVCNKSPS